MWKYLLLQAYIFWALKKKIKKNNFFFEFEGAKTLDVRLSVRNALFLLPTWDPANFWCVYTELNSKNNASYQKLLGLLFGEIGSWKWKKRKSRQIQSSILNRICIDHNSDVLKLQLSAWFEEGFWLWVLAVFGRNFWVFLGFPPFPYNPKIALRASRSIS